MNEKKMFHFLLKSLENSSQVVFMMNVNEKYPFFANNQALDYYCNDEGTVEINSIFTNKISVDHFTSSAYEQLQKKDFAFIYDVSTTTKTGEIKICDIQVKYCDEEHQVVFLELFQKVDKRMEDSIKQVNQSQRAEGIFNLDEGLSLVHCNHLFYDVFEMTPELAITHYNNELSNSFLPDVRENLLAEIHENLVKSDHYTTKLKVITTKSQEKWYLLQTQRRTLDNSGLDKILVTMENIESQVELAEELDEISRYFTVLQSMYNGMLYRFDIKNRILHRTQEIASSLDLPPEGVSYPIKEQIQGVIHPDDLEEYMDFIEKVAHGEEGSLDSRISLKDGNYEYHRMTFKALRKKDGTVEEMIGLGQNVDYIRQTEEKLDSVNQYFIALQNLSDDMLYRVNLETKTLFRTTEQAEMFGLKPMMTNYPDSILESGIIHPEDEKLYLKYGYDLLSGMEGQAEIRIKSTRGEYEFSRLTCSPVYGANGKVKEMFGKIVNIQMVRELEEQANYDALTKLLNKRAMLEFTSKTLLEATKTDRHALFFMDLDDFKYVNDNLGHAFGDFLLGELGKRLRDGVRQQDFVGRVGGDEFVIFLRDVPSLDMVLGKAKMILSTISEDFSDGTTRHTMHGSLGVAIYPEHGESYEELYHHADLALYSSKHKGKNQVTIYDGTMKEDTSK